MYKQREANRQAQAKQRAKGMTKGMTSEGMTVSCSPLDVTGVIPKLEAPKVTDFTKTTFKRGKDITTIEAVAALHKVISKGVP